MLMYPNKTGEIRDDAGGSGHYGAKRSKTVSGVTIHYKHQGVDYSVTPGQDIISPITCKVKREARPYASGPYSGVLLEGIRGVFKIFYMELLDGLIGTSVRQGDVIGHAQDISKKYAGVTAHVHLEIVSLDPEILMSK